ncbi:MAG TPA: tetratricopeptide repeat protein [bacterium]|nr:tetratricopeptide repeat protein [bacterium]
MDSGPLTSLIEIEGKNFTIATTPVSGKNRVSSLVQLGGRAISQREFDLPEGLDEDGLKHYLHETHRIRSVELESIFRLNRKIDEKPTPDACWKIGVIFLSNGFYEDARQKFLKSLEMDPHHLQALKSYGITLALLEDFDGALATLNHARELGPSFADIYFHVGNIHLYKRELDEAVQCYLQALQINPRYADARLRLATACVGYLASSSNSLVDNRIQEMSERAKSEAETAATLNPKVRNRAFMLATDYLKNRKYSQAFQAFMDVRPKYVPRIGDEIIFFFTLTLLYGSEGIDLQMTDQYIDRLTKVIEEYPHYADLHHHLGTAYLIKCRFDVNRSMKEFKKALEINPQFQKAVTNFGETEGLHKNILTVLKKAIIPQGS